MNAQLSVLLYLRKKAQDWFPYDQGQSWRKLGVLLLPWWDLSWDVLNVSWNPAMAGVTRGYCNTQYYFLCMSDIHSSCQNWGLSSNFFGRENDVNRNNYIIKSVFNCLARLTCLGISLLRTGQCLHGIHQHLHWRTNVAMGNETGRKNVFPLRLNSFTSKYKPACSTVKSTPQKHTYAD